MQPTSGGGGGLNPGYNPDWDLKGTCKQLAQFVSGWSTANGSYLVAVCVNAFNPD